MSVPVGSDCPALPSLLEETDLKHTHTHTHTVAENIVLFVFYTNNNHNNNAYNGKTNKNE